MSRKRPPTCAHGNPKSMCWHCLSPEQQERSRRVWDRVEALPDFAEGIKKAKEEIADGKVIQMTRKGKTVVFPHSTFRKLVDIIHAEKEERGDVD